MYQNSRLMQSQYDAQTQTIHCLFVLSLFCNLQTVPLHHIPVCNGTKVIISGIIFMKCNPVYVLPLASISRWILFFLLWKKECYFSSLLQKKKSSLYRSLKTVSYASIFTIIQYNQKWKVVTKNKMDNPRFVNEEGILLVQDEDYDDYNTPNTSRVEETSFTEPDATETTSTLELRQKVKRDKITALYRHLNVTVDPCLADMDRFMIKKKSKTGNTDLFFLDGNKHWQSFTNKRTVNFKRQRHGEKNLVD